MLGMPGMTQQHFVRPQYQMSTQMPGMLMPVNQQMYRKLQVNPPPLSHFVQAPQPMHGYPMTQPLKPQPPQQQPMMGVQASYAMNGFQSPMPQTPYAMNG